MDQDTKNKLQDIIQKEIQIEDDMLGLYSNFLKQEEFLNNLSENDKNLVVEILNSLLRDTSKHKQEMKNIINNL